MGISIEDAIAENIRRGYIELVEIDENGESRYRLTEAGKAHVEELIEGGADEGTE